MYLFLDNSVVDKIVIKLGGGSKWSTHTFSGAKYVLLTALDSALKKNKLTLKKLKGVAVLTGQGRFTALRIAVTVANSLALSLNIPVLAVNKFEPNLDKKLRATSKKIFISAKYSAGANIGGKQNVK